MVKVEISFTFIIADSIVRIAINARFDFHLTSDFGIDFISNRIVFHCVNNSICKRLSLNTSIVISDNLTVDMVFSYNLLEILNNLREA